MLVRRPLPWILLLAALLHGLGIARTPLPAQDGLKYIRVARAFQSQPWTDVIRSSDQHPLYPWLVSRVQPILAPLTSTDADSWRFACQVVSLLATLALLTALYDWTKHFTSRRTAVWACLLLLMLPVPARLGHDTLSDPLAWAATLGSLTLGLRWLQSGRRSQAIATGLLAGLGYLTRPEVALVPVALLTTAAASRWPIRRFAGRWTPAWISASRPDEGPAAPATPALPPVLARLAETWIIFLVLVGSYTLVKGEVSEKLAVRLAAGLGPSSAGAPANPAMPRGFEGQGWDFSPKEESDHLGHFTAVEAARRLLQATGEGLGWLGGALAIAGALLGRCRCIGRTASRLAVVFGLLYAVVLTRHAVMFGYLSERHVVPLVLLCLPRAAMGLRESLIRLGGWRRWSWSQRRVVRLLAVASMLVAATVIQARPGHPSRWGHWAAGQWLANHAQDGEAVLDTRGWASFSSGLPNYDYWHVRQALSDQRLAYIVVTRDELDAASARARTLRALLGRACTLAIAYPERPGGRDASIRVYRFEPPRHWGGDRP